jgi:hypothetical protein
MPIIIQETEVQVAQGGSRGEPAGTTPTATSAGAGEQGGSTHVVPLRPADVERIHRYLAARVARVRAD